MSNVNEYQVQYAIDELRSKASQFFAASQSVQARASYLLGISLNITYCASDWAGSGSDAFINTWSEYDSHSRRAIDALDRTGNAFNNLANKLENALQTKREADQRANMLLLGAIGLSLVDILQLGMDPLTDAALAGTAAGAAAAAAEAVDLASLIAIADSGSAGEFMSVVTSDVGLLQGIDEGILYNGAGSAIDPFYDFGAPPGDVYVPGVGLVSDSSESGFNDVSLENEGGNSSLFVGHEDSLYSISQTDTGNFYGASVSETSRLELGNYSYGFGINNDDGSLNVGLQSSYTALKMSEDGRLGSTNLGATAGVEADVGEVDAFVGLHKGELGAEVGVTGISETGSIGMDVGGKNLSLDGTIGLKAQLGFEIGPKTEIKLPFISFGFSFGDAK